MVHRAVATRLISSMNTPRTRGVTLSRANGSITVMVDMNAPYRLNTLIDTWP
ncbi:hypothetical protein D9M71_582930 [compost metagenome]